MNLSELLRREIRRKGTGERLGKVEDALVDVRRGEIVYLLMTTGSTRPYVILSRGRVTIGDDAVEADVDDQQLESLQAGAGAARTPDGPLDLGTMPPLVVGPFGHVVSPAIGAAVFNALTGRDRHQRPALDAAHADWHWFETLHGLPVFDATSELGALDGIVFDPDALLCRTLTLRDDGGKLYDLPFGSIRMVSRGETSIVLELSPKPPYSVDRITEELR